MLRPQRVFASHLGRSNLNAAQFSRSFSTEASTVGKASHSIFRIGDRVLFSWTQSRELRKKLSNPLRQNGMTVVNGYEIPHHELIDLPSYTYVKKASKDGTKRVQILAQHPSFDDFTSLSPRRVAPIYSSYASTIVDLLNIHVDPPSSANDPELIGRSLQILEAGTGHGSLTMHLSRAIAAANPPPPTSFDAHGQSGDEAEPSAESWKQWRDSRRAVIHTVDIEKENSKHASETIKSFRHALYWPHIDFHTGNVQDWLSARTTEGGEGSHFDAIILDLPDFHHIFESAANCLKLGGRLLVFVPQITQIAQGVQEVKNKSLPLMFDGGLELGDGISTGRLWDVRVANVRADKGHPEEDLSANEDDRTPFTEDDVLDPSQPPPNSDFIRPMVCRPRVFERTRGGGFVGIWRKRGFKDH